MTNLGGFVALIAWGQGVIRCFRAFLRPKPKSLTGDSLIYWIGAAGRLDPPFQRDG
jgi:hypothetical protein